MTQNIPLYLKGEINRINHKIAEAKDSLNDPQLVDLAKEEIKLVEKQKKALLSTPKIKKKAPIKPGQRLGNAIIEIRSATGGDEAKIWAEDLREMYIRFTDIKGLEVTLLGSNSFKVKGKTAYPLFQHEAGVHRVQRVPSTETQGRIHTSTATVAVLPEVKETEIVINPADITEEFYRSSGSGGQNVNKVSTAVRLRHAPSQTVIESQTQRTQEQNRKIAMDILRSKLYQIREKERLAQLSSDRAAVGRGMRSEKIRTYNFPQNRVTDHRIKKSFKNLDRVLQGDLGSIVELLQESL